MSYRHRHVISTLSAPQPPQPPHSVAILAQVATWVHSRGWVSACNRYVALVQCCHVPLVVVFSTNVLVGHVFRCSCAFVPNERFRGPWLPSRRGQFEGFFLEPVSVAPSLQVFALKGYDLHASVRALAEIASGRFETDSKDTFLPSRCDMCGLTRFAPRVA